MERGYDNDKYVVPTLVSDERAGTAIAGERHGVTFASFSLASDAAPTQLPEHDDAYLTVDNAMRRLVEVVYAYEGTIDRFTPDGFLALFGVPVSHENDPERAVRAVLEMQAVADELSLEAEERGWNVCYQGIVHTSQVQVSNINANLDIIYSAPPNIIDELYHLRTAAPINKVVISTTTQRHVRTLFELHATQPFPLVRSETPLAGFEVRGQLPTLQKTIAKMLPMIGRQHELQRLHTAWEHAFHHGRSQWVFLTGESGIGKTRLMTEFEQALSKRGNVMHSGVCMSHMRHRSLWPIAAMLRAMLHIAPEMPLPKQGAILDAYMNRAGLSYEENAPFLRSVLGIPQPDPVLERRMRFLDPAVLQRQTHAALRQVLVAESSGHRSVFVLEDIQWLDPASQAFLQYLLQSQAVGDTTLMFVLVARAGVGIASMPVLEDVREAVPGDVVDLHLEALSAEEQQRLLNQLLPLASETSTTLREQITQRAHGNPLYLEQIVQMLIDQQAVVQTQWGWDFADTAHSVLNAVPDTIHALMLARFDLLAEHLRRTLQKAAICRTSFPLELLQALDARSSDNFDEHIAELVARNFLLPQLVGQESSYSFNHPLLQEVIYETLLADDRQTLHDQAAAAIGNHTWLSGYERIESLAYHYTRGTEPVRAVPFLIEAAEHAAHRYANDVAIAQYEQAVTLMQQHPAVRARYFAPAGLGLGRARKFAGAWTPAFEVLQQTLSVVHSESRSDGADVDMQVQVLCELADVRYREGAQEAAVSFLETGQAVLGSGSDGESAKLRRLLADRLAMIRFRQGKLEEAFALAHEAVHGTHQDVDDDPLTLASLYNTLGGVQWQQGRLSEAVVYVEQSRVRYEEMGYSFGVATALMNLGILLYAQGAWQQAAEYFERSDQVRRDIGYIVGRANNLLNLALLRLAMGDHERCGNELRESSMLSQRLGDDYGVTRAEIGLGHLAIVEKRFKDAEVHLDHAEALLQSAGEDETVQVYALQALVATHKGQLADGIALAEKAVALARSAGVTEQEAECLRVLGVLFGRAEAYETAEVALQASLDICQTAQDSYQAGLTFLERARLRTKHATQNAFQQTSWIELGLLDVQEAIERFSALGARFDLREAYDLLAELRGPTLVLHEFSPRTALTPPPDGTSYPL